LTTKPSVRIALSAALVLVVLALAPIAPAAPPGGGHGGGGGGKGSCMLKTPGVVIDNNWQWGTPGSWGLPGQQLTYAIDVINYDVGCGSSTFAVSVSAPAGFSVSSPTNTIALKSSSSGYLWTNVTSPNPVADDDYPVTVTVQRTGTSNVSATNYYKVYSSDTVAPTLYWANPGNGTTISGRSYNLSVSSSDDHAVKKIDLYIDNVYSSTASCNDISYSCQLTYNWPTRAGQHTATFRSYDWMGNVGETTVSFTVT
jgi:hypothetical protein